MCVCVKECPFDEHHHEQEPSFSSLSLSPCLSVFPSIFHSLSLLSFSIFIYHSFFSTFASLFISLFLVFYLLPPPPSQRNLIIFFLFSSLPSLSLILFSFSLEFHSFLFCLFSILFSISLFPFRFLFSDKPKKQSRESNISSKRYFEQGIPV